jgi:hypothetical protein
MGAALDEVQTKKGVLYDPEVVVACSRLLNEKNYQIKIIDHYGLKY